MRKLTKINFPIWLGATTADMMRFGLGGALPGTVIIGRDGRVAKVISGVVNLADLKKQVDSMLAGSETTAAKESKQDSEPQQSKSEASTVPS